MTGREADCRWSIVEAYFCWMLHQSPARWKVLHAGFYEYVKGVWYEPTPPVRRIII